MNTMEYDELFERLDALCAGETDEIALMATIACEVYNAFEKFNWVGFYRKVDADLLKVGPYQGTHGCLAIPYNRGVCGQCARNETVQYVPNVEDLPCHIACSSTTQSEWVGPVFNAEEELIAVFDIDSNQLDAFDETDLIHLPKLSKYFAAASN